MPSPLQSTTTQVEGRFTEFLTWRLPFSLDGRDFYQRRGTLYVETVAGSQEYETFKPCYSTAHDSDAFKRAEQLDIISNVTGEEAQRHSARGKFQGLRDECLEM